MDEGPKDVDILQWVDICAGRTPLKLPPECDSQFVALGLAP